MIKLMEMFEDNQAKQLIKKYKKLLNKEVDFKYEKTHYVGTLAFVGVSPLAKANKSEYYTFTINRTPVRVYDITKVKIEVK